MTDDDRRESQSCLRLTLLLTATAAPDIIELDIVSFYNPSSLSAPLAQLQALRAFETLQMDTAELHVLATLPNLKKLTVKNIEGPDPLWSPHTSTGFLCLEYLCIMKYPHDSRFNIFHSASILRELQIWDYQWTHIHKLRESCAAWSRWFPLLEVLNFDISVPLEAVPGYPQSYYNVLEPLFQLQSLKSISADAPVQLLHLDDTVIQAIGRAWPNLYSARFRLTALGIGQTLDDTTPCLSPSPLVSLALRCPRLHTLMVPQVKITVDNMEALSEYPILDHSLSHLHILRMFSSDYSLVDRFVGRLFPRPPGSVELPRVELSADWKDSEGNQMSVGWPDNMMFSR